MDTTPKGRILQGQPSRGLDADGLTSFYGSRELKLKAPRSILPGDWPEASWGGVIEPQDESRAYWEA